MKPVRSKSTLGVTLGLMFLALILGLPVRGDELFPDPCTVGVVSWIWSPGSQESRDLNLDGILDIVVVSYDQPYFNVLLGRGDGRFDVSRFDHPGNGMGLALEDLDEDGFADIVTSRRGLDQIAIYLGNGDGTFGPPLDIPAPAPLYDGSSFHVADLNGDGHFDLIAGVPGEHWTYLGNGDGTFEPPTLLHSADAICALGQFDAEDPVDLACAQGSQVCTYRGDGAGGFLHDSEIDCIAASALKIAAGNLDGEGLDEIVVVAHGKATVVTRAPTLTWGRPVDHPLADSFAVDVALADFDDDGDLDSVISHRNQLVLSTLLNDGTGGFGPVTAVATTLRLGMVEVGDFDGDEALDVMAIAEYNAAVHFLQGRGDGTFRGSGIPRLDGEYLMAHGDYDGNGTLDFVSGNGQTATEITPFFNDGTGVLSSAAPIPVTGAVVAAVTADFDSNGTSDILFAYDEGASSPGALLAGHGDGTFATESPVMFEVAVRSWSGRDLVTAFLNDDAYLDVVALANPPTALQILFGSPDGGLAPDAVLQLPSLAGQMLVADADGDEAMDLVVSLSQRIAVYRGDGLGGFASPIFSSTLGPTTGSAGGLMALVELGRDAWPDLVVSSKGSTSPGSTELQILQGNGDGTFGVVTVLPTPSQVFNIVVGDYDGDDRDDLAINYGTGYEIGLNRGDGTLRRAGEYCGRPLVSGDLNGNGRADLLWGSGRALNLSPLVFGFGQDRDTLEWPPVDQALAYDIYRGLVSDLAAGVGYGACITYLDADPTDNAFSDPEVPPQSSAYFYLRATLLPDGDSGLGSASDGTLRIPAEECP